MSERAFINSKSQAAKDFKLAVQSFLEYLCWHGADYRMALDTVEEYASCSWDSAYYQTHGLRTATVEEVVHPSDATSPRHNSTPVITWTHTQGGFTR